MRRRSVILKKKLHELEFRLAAMFRRPLDAKPDPRHQAFVDDIKQRFIFLKSLLAAEAASRPQDIEQLRETGEKLAGLEAAFRGWDSYRNSALSNYPDDTQSVCCDCTQALTLYGDDTETNGDFLADNFAGEKSAVKCLDEINVRKEGWGRIGKYCGVFGSGVIVGAICMIELITSSSHFFFQRESFLLPPT